MAKLPEGFILSEEEPSLPKPSLPEGFIVEEELDEQTAADRRLQAYMYVAEGKWKDAEPEGVQKFKEREDPKINFFAPSSPIMSLTGPTVSPPEETAEYKREKSKAQRQDLTEKTAEFMQVLPDQIDVDSGLPLSDRTMMGINKREPQVILNNLNEKYGQDNVFEIKTDKGKSNYLVFKDGKYILADELGFTLRDVADASRDISTFLGETVPPVALAIANPLTKIRYLALAAGSGRAATELGFETLEELSNLKLDEDFKLRTKEGATTDFNISYSLLKGLESGAAEGVFGKVAQTVSKLVSKPGRTGEAFEFDQFRNDLAEIKEKYGIDIPETPGSTVSPEMAMREAYRAGTKPNSASARNREAVRDAIADLEKAMLGDFKGDFEVVLSNFQKRFKEFSATENAIIAKGDTAVQTSLDNFSEKVLNNLSRVNSTVATEASNTRKLFQDTTKIVDDEVTRRYNEVKLLMPDVEPVRYEVLAKALIESLPDVPVDAKKKILASFLPKNAIQILRQSKELSAAVKRNLPDMVDSGLVDKDGQPIFLAVGEPEALTLSFSDLVNLKKNYSRMYAALDNTTNKVDRKAVADALKAVETVMADMAEASGSDAFRLLKEADEYYRVNKVPLDSDPLLHGKRGILDYNKDGNPLVDDESLLNNIFNKSDPQRFARLDRLKNLSADPVAFNEQIRASIVSRLRARATDNDGFINIRGLRQLIADPDLAEKYFAPDAIKDINQILNNYKFYRNPDAVSMPTELLDEFLTATEPARRKEIRTLIDQSIASNTRQKSLTSNAIIQSLNDPNEFAKFDANQLMSMLTNDKTKRSQVKQALNLMDDETKRHVKVLLRKYLLDNARFGSQNLTGKRLSQIEVSDGSTLDKIINNPKTRDLMQDVLGADGVKDFQRLIRVLKYSGEVVQATADQGPLKGVKYIISGNNSRFYSGVPIDGYLSNLYAMMLESPTGLKLLNELSDDGASTFKILLPTILGSQEATEVMLSEMGVNPGFADFISNALSSYDSEGDEELANRIEDTLKKTPSRKK